MCGISGYIAFSPQPASLIRKMTDIIAHRGPDDEGFVLFSDAEAISLGGKDTPESSYSAGLPFSPSAGIAEHETREFSLALGHRRLSIVDVSAAGHQPMCTRDGRFWISYNGEIYNHIELRAELEGLGHSFRSHSDTEVILAAYREWGEKCLSRFNGMFAILIHDRERKTLFVARDRFGVKPLYYRITGQGIAFASEIKQFTLLPDWKSEINGQRAYDFLVWGVIDHTDETLFSNVYQLRPGHYAMLEASRPFSVRDGRLTTTQWYELQPVSFQGSFEDAAAEFRRLLEESVSLRLRADVPVGSCLSGGLDSSSIVCLMNESLRKQDAHALQKTFSACSEVGRFDERSWIDEVVGKTGVDAHYVYPSLDRLFEESPEITWHQDEPFGSTSIYAQWNVFRLAAGNGVKVMLDGQGADEQLAGYHGFFSPRLASLLRSLKWIDLVREVSGMRRLHGYSPMKAAQYLANGVFPQALRDLLRRTQGLTHRAPDWLNADALNCIPADPFAALDGKKSSSIQGFSKVQLTSSTLQMLLHWEDRDSMAHSIEARVPFLDYRLVEFVLGLPDDFKLAEGLTKRVLRVGMSGILPDRIRDRVDKLGFVTAEEVWMREKARDAFRARLDAAIDLSNGILKPSSRNLFEEMAEGIRPFNFQVWRMISFGEWLDRFGIGIRSI